jgi:DnaK suppressor protein
MPLNQEQQSELRTAMNQRRDQLAQEIRNDFERSRQDNAGAISAPAGDAGDESVADLLAHLDQFDATRDVGELRAIEAAHGRMDDGSYGTCENCGNDIGFERLKASPTAVRCIACQRQYEKTHASPATPTL